VLKSELPAPTLSVSVVVYRSDPLILLQTLQSLYTSLHFTLARRLITHAGVYIICNDDSADELAAVLTVLPPHADIELRIQSAPANIGYGAAHNIVIAAAGTAFHLILNPDVILAPDTLHAGLSHLIDNPELSAASPLVTDDKGHRQYLCKRYPRVLDLVLRGFMPAAVRNRFQQRLAWYEMRDLSDELPSADIPIISGCFMLFRTSRLQELGGFNSRYFLYFEDFDLSLRAAATGRLAYVPAMRIVHLGGHSARKGWRHISLFVRSGIRFYSTWGWRLW
jgi:GT2 family glycosyltransferase